MIAAWRGDTFEPLPDAARTGRVKRSGPLNRRTGLQRSGPIRANPNSKARADRKAHREQRPAPALCERCRSRPPVDPSHKAPGSLRPDLRASQPVDWLCRPCHTWVEERPADAEAEGWRSSEKYELDYDPMDKIRRQLEG